MRYPKINKTPLDFINKHRFNNLYRVIGDSLKFDNKENELGLSKKDIEMLAWNLSVNIISQPYQAMRKGSHMTLEQRRRVSEGLKGVVPWNKGIKTATEKPCKRLRRDGNYYLSELKSNAIRGIKKGYNKDEKKGRQSKERRQEVQKMTGAFQPMRYWTQIEEDYLKENYRDKTVLEVALYLDRSWVSVMHKITRLKLKKYNNWTKQKL